jgi:transposase InsO family protein
MEQRYHAVMEVVSGAPVTEVARRYGVSRQAVHGWLGRYEREGLAGLADHSHRVLVRHGLVAARKRRRRREDYKRWQREEPMQLWQLDVTASVFLADGTELKLISGIDDHSRFCVIAAVVRRATARAVCGAFLAAMAVYGIPEEVLTDNGKQFTGRFGKPRPAASRSPISASRPA